MHNLDFFSYYYVGDSMKLGVFYSDKIKYDCSINDLVNNSKSVKAKDVYYCCEQNHQKGINYIKEAIKNGAKAIVLSFDYESIIDESTQVNYIYREDVPLSYARDLYKLYKYIFKKIKVITVTGTNGKTTVSSLLYKYFHSNNINASLVGSNGNYVMDQYYPTQNTTDDIYTIYSLLKESYEKNVKYFIMEASSHGIKGLRIKSIPITLSIYTNLTLDHLDYHITMDDYKYTKLLHLKDSQKVILNKDDENYKLFSKYLDNYVTYGRNKSNYSINSELINVNQSRFNFCVNGKESYYFITNLLGKFNIDNIAAFLSALFELNLFDYGRTYTFLKNFTSISGRMEYFNLGDNHYYIDFAHTPDGVKNVLSFLNSIKRNRIITVIGCGGSRDKLKRKLIGEISSNLSDVVIYTTDNPRDEDEEEIINQIIEGVKKSNYIKIISRAEAIDKAIDIASKDDIIAILGKGNEEFIIKRNVKLPYNDKTYLLSKFKEVK